MIGWTGMTGLRRSHTPAPTVTCSRRFVPPAPPLTWARRHRRMVGPRWSLAAARSRGWAVCPARRRGERPRPFGPARTGEPALGIVVETIDILRAAMPGAGTAVAARDDVLGPLATDVPARLPLARAWD